jgi:hypothetical protein
MPYVVTSPTLCESFPHNCPYCGMSPASTSVRQPYSKMGPGGISGQVQSQTWKVELPACQECAKWFSLSRICLFLLGFSSLLLPILAVVTDSYGVAVCWFLALGGWLGLLIWRRCRMQELRIAYIGPGEVVYAMRSEAYARDFASRNNLTYERRALVVRFA